MKREQFLVDDDEVDDEHLHEVGQWVVKKHAKEDRWLLYLWGGNGQHRRDGSPHLTWGEAMSAARMAAQYPPSVNDLTPTVRKQFRDRLDLDSP